LGIAISVSSSLAAGFLVILMAGSQQVSFKIRHWFEYGDRNPVVAVDSATVTDVDEYGTAHSAAWNYWRSAVRDDIIHIPSSIDAIYIALEKAHAKNDQIMERAILRQVFDIDRSTKDFTAVRIGVGTRAAIDRIYETYDPDGSIRRQFDSEINSK
jgi:hypothetical protein